MKKGYKKILVGITALSLLFSNVLNISGNTYDLSEVIDLKETDPNLTESETGLIESFKNSAVTTTTSAIGVEYVEITPEYIKELQEKIERELDIELETQLAIGVNVEWEEEYFIYEENIFSKLITFTNSDVNYKLTGEFKDVAFTTKDDEGIAPENEKYSITLENFTSINDIAFTQSSAITAVGSTLEVVLVGENNIHCSNDDDLPEPSAWNGYNAASAIGAINGGNLTLIGRDGNKLNATLEYGYGSAIIGSPYRCKAGDITLNNVNLEATVLKGIEKGVGDVSIIGGNAGNININGGSITSINKEIVDTVVIGAGHEIIHANNEKQSVGNITITDATIEAATLCGVGIGAQKGGIVNDIIINNSNITINSKDLEISTYPRYSIGIGGYIGSKISDIKINGGIIEISSSKVGIGIDGIENSSKMNDIIINNAQIVSNNENTSIGIGTGADSNTKMNNIVIDGEKTNIEVTSEFGAGIGASGGQYIPTNGNLVVKGPVIEKIYIKNGTISARSEYHGAGIGSDQCSNVKEILIEGGNITATSNYAGPGIGISNDSNSKINITGGTIYAEGGTSKVNGINGPGIGTAATEVYSQDNIISYPMKNYLGEINISGGTIEAVGGDGAAAIGIGETTQYGNHSEIRSIKITGGEIVARAGAGAAAIGTSKYTEGRQTPSVDSIIISGNATVTAIGPIGDSKGAIGKNKEGAGIGSLAIYDTTNVKAYANEVPAISTGNMSINKTVGNSANIVNARFNSPLSESEDIVISAKLADTRRTGSKEISLSLPANYRYFGYTSPVEGAYGHFTKDEVYAISPEDLNDNKIYEKGNLVIPTKKDEVFNVLFFVKQNSPKPSIDPILVGTKKISGKGREVGADILITLNDKTSFATKVKDVDNELIWEVDISDHSNKIIEGEYVTATQTLQYHYTSDVADRIIADTNVPAPIISKAYDTHTKVSGTGLPGHIVKVILKNKNGDVVATLDNIEVAKDGKWSIGVDYFKVETLNNLTIVENIEATQRSKTRKVSAPTIKEVLKSVKINEIKESDTLITGTGEPGTDITVEFPTGDKLAGIVVNGNGKWEVALKAEQREKLISDSLVKAVQRDKDGDLTEDTTTVIMKDPVIVDVIEDDVVDEDIIDEVVTDENPTYLEVIEDNSTNDKEPEDNSTNNKEPEDNSINNKEPEDISTDNKVTEGSVTEDKVTVDNVTENSEVDVTDNDKKEVVPVTFPENFTFEISEEEGLVYIYDENHVPLGTITLEDYLTGNFDNMIPFGSGKFTNENIDLDAGTIEKTNPKTDSDMKGPLTLILTLIIAMGVVFTYKKRIYK